MTSDKRTREDAMIVVSRKDDGTPDVWCDPCLVPLVKALNDGGQRTVASCCGHGERPGTVALADGRELLVVTYTQARALETGMRWTHGPCACQ